MKIQFYLTDVSPLRNTFDKAYAFLTPMRMQRVDAQRGIDAKLRLMGAGLLLRNILNIRDDAQLVCNEYGKPFISGGAHFSISHSGKWCALAVSDAPVGADIEVPRGISSEMIRRCLTDAEQAWCCGSQERFLQLWTRKESIMKACGEGIAMGLKNISALPCEKTAAGGKLWTVETFQMDECVCSVAGENDLHLLTQRISAYELLRN